MSHYRTKLQNELVVERILDYLASGHTMKEVGSDFRIPHDTVTSLLSRYRRRYKFRTTFQMLAAYVQIKQCRKRK